MYTLTNIKTVAENHHRSQEFNISRVRFRSSLRIELGVAHYKVQLVQELE